ncbi:hypothetical protein GCM10007897_38630 [Sphingobium jiangsuense]|nr:hypothetical protein GCM10007897_38630 [Sphingobium jiangsuense]
MSRKMASWTATYLVEATGGPATRSARDAIEWQDLNAKPPVGDHMFSDSKARSPTRNMPCAPIFAADVATMYDKPCRIGEG